MFAQLGSHVSFVHVHPFRIDYWDVIDLVMGLHVVVPVPQ